MNDTVAMDEFRKTTLVAESENVGLIVVPSIYGNQGMVTREVRLPVPQPGTEPELSCIADVTRIVQMVEAVLSCINRVAQSQARGRRTGDSEDTGEQRWGVP